MHFRQYNLFIFGLVCSVTASFAFCNDELNSPIVNAIYVDNSILDVTTGNQTLTITVDATDDSDIDWPSSYISLTEPNSPSNRYIYGSNENPGTFTTSFIASDEGIWRPEFLRVYDVYSNYFFAYREGDFNALGLTSLIVNNGFYDDINQVELNSPIVNAIYVDNSILDVTTGNQTLTITVDATDDSDIDWPSSYIALDDPYSGNPRWIYGSNENPGTFTTSFSALDEGVWRPKFLRVYDVYSNYFFERSDTDFTALGLTGLIVNNGFYDDINQVELNSPIVNAIYVDSSIIDVKYEAKTVTINVNATDDSDIYWPSSYIALDDPNSPSNRYIYGSNENPGTFTTSFIASDEGIWRPEHLFIYDVFNNYFFEYTQSDFTALGFEGLVVNNGFFDIISPSKNWDFDENNSVDALTDGLLILRYAFGLRGENLTNAAIGSGSSLTSEEVATNVEQAASLADIDNSGTLDALTDGLIFLRYAFGLRGDSLLSGAISSDANRTSASDIEAYIESHMP